jgi:hypothetical protein
LLEVIGEQTDKAFLSTHYEVALLELGVQKKFSSAKTHSHLPSVTTEKRRGNDEVILRACFDGIHGIAG